MKPHILSVNRPSHGLRWGLCAIVVTAVAAGIFYAYDRDVAKPQASVLTISRTAAPQILAYPNGQTTETGIAPPGARTATPIWDRSSLAAAFDRLAKSSEPADKYAAWKLVEDCKWAHIITPNDASPEVCGDLKPGQWDGGQVRADLIRVAALAGVHHAWWDLRTREGPGAAFHSFAEGPEYQALEIETHRIALAAADPQALMVEQGKQMKTDPTKSIAMWAAFRMSRAADTAQPYDPATDAYLAELATKRGADLPQAITTAKALIAAANRSQK